MPTKPTPDQAKDINQQLAIDWLLRQIYGSSAGIPFAAKRVKTDKSLTDGAKDVLLERISEYEA